jgi:MtaA/CmuA family methyltransferase
MTPQQRYLGCIHGEPVDHLARVPILMQFAAEYIGSNYGRFAADYRVLAEANIRCAHDFGFDQLSAISDPYRETAGFGGSITYVDNGVPRCRAPLEDDDAIEVGKLSLPDVMACDRMRDRIDGVRLMRSRVGDHYSVLGWVEGPAAEAADLRGLSNFFMDLLEDEPGSCSLMDLTLDNAIRFAAAQIAAGADTIGIGEAMASQVSAEVYERLIFPRTLRLVQSIRDAGAYVKMHICGNITHLLPLLRRLPINVIDVDHLVELKSARQALGRDICICTNLDPAGLVQHGTPQLIRTALTQAYSALGNPCIINAGCEIPAATPYDNLRALCSPLTWSPNPV